MTQDLFDWLNSTHNDKAKDYSGAEGLLLAPILDGQTDNFASQDEVVLPEPELPEIETLTPQDNIIEATLSEKITALNDAWQAENLNAEDSYSYDEIYSGNDTYSVSEDTFTDLYTSKPEDDDSNETSSDASAANASHDISYDDDALPDNDDFSQDNENLLLEDEDALDEDALPSDEDSAPDHEDASQDDEHTSILNQAWHEATGFHINFDDPPPQMWTDIDQDLDDESVNYEENDSLQGDAYIPVVKHGANFTQRLQSTLKSRKDRAAKQHKLEAENANPHPYVQKALIFCGVLLMTLGFVYLGLWFISRETPDKLNERAKTQYEKGNFDEAANLYGRGYKRYPQKLMFLTGLAQSAEKAGRTQTAIAAWNEYLSSLPQESIDHRQEARSALDRLIPGAETHIPEPTTIQTVALPSVPLTSPKSQDIPRTTRPSLPEVRATTFDDALEEGNNAYNIGMFSRAISSFHKAHAIRPDDLRPYIGLIASYRAKGMFFDAKRLIDEARKKFGRISELEIESYYLRRE